MFTTIGERETMKLRYSALYIAMTAVFASGAAHAAGQQADQPSASAPAASKVKNLDTIQVTATKRETPLQKTPVAITAISGDTLDKERVMTVQDLTKLVPGLQGTSEGCRASKSIKLAFDFDAIAVGCTSCSPGPWHASPAQHGHGGTWRHGTRNALASPACDAAGIRHGRTHGRRTRSPRGRHGYVGTPVRIVARWGKRRPGRHDGRKSVRRLDGRCATGRQHGHASVVDGALVRWRSAGRRPQHRLNDNNDIDQPFWKTPQCLPSKPCPTKFRTMKSRMTHHRFTG